MRLWFHPSFLIISYVRIIKKLLITLNARIICYPRYSMKNKIKLLLPFSIYSRSLASTYCAWLTTPFSAHRFIFLSYSTGCCFIFSHNRPAEQLQKRGGKVKKKRHIWKRSANFLNFGHVMAGGKEEHFALLKQKGLYPAHHLTLEYLNIISSSCK